MRDETFVEAGDDEVAEEDAEDEFASYFSNSTSPKVILTTSRKPSGEMFKFLENLFTVIPNAYYYARRAYHIQEIVKHATARGFTDLLVFNENKKFSHGAKSTACSTCTSPRGPRACTASLPLCSPRRSVTTVAPPVITPSSS